MTATFSVNLPDADAKDLAPGPASDQIREMSQQKGTHQKSRFSTTIALVEMCLRWIATSVGKGNVLRAMIAPTK